MRILDGILIGFTMMLVMAVGGLPFEWLFDLLSAAALALEGFALAVLSAVRG
jgi:hypothetical protein